MKIALLTDLHLGIHSDDQIFLDYQRKFFEEIFFPYLEKYKIKDVISLGDEFDSRKNINYNTLSNSKEFFFDRIENDFINLKIILGNHNLFYKHDLDVNSPKLLFDKYEYIEIVEESKEILYDGIKFLLVPWISKNNKEEILSEISKTDAEYLLGHFEISGIKLHSNWQYDKGIEQNILNKFKEVWSGHYHTQIKKDNFTYLGSCFQLTWNDTIFPKYFYVFDTKTCKLEAIENTLKIYGYIEYNSNIDINSFNYKEYHNRHIRIILNEKPENYINFDLFIKKLEEYVYSCQVVEKFYDKIDITSEETSQVESTIDTIYNACKSNGIVNEEKLFKYLKTVYNKANLNLE